MQSSGIRMKKVIIKICLLATLYVCNSEAQSVAAATIINSTIAKPQVSIPIKKSFKSTSKYAAEIQEIDAEVAKINAALGKYQTKAREVGECKVKEFVDADDMAPKIERICKGGVSWEFYSLIWPNKTSKLVYWQYKKGTTFRESYSIGSMIKGTETFGLFLDGNGAKLEGAEYSTLNQEQEMAYATSL